MPASIKMNTGVSGFRDGESQIKCTLDQPEKFNFIELFFMEYTFFKNSF
jgi:hypothetical protein